MGNKVGKVALRALTTVSVLALVLGAAASVAPHNSLSMVSAAWAEGEGEDGNHDGAEGHQGGQGQGSQGAQSGQGKQGQGSGQGGPGPDSDGKGPQAGGPSASSGDKGKPNWAQEGIPEVELGRLSVARAPDQVLDRALAEALASATPEMISFYNQSLDDMIADISANWDTLSFFDSPLQNLGLLKDALDGTSVLADQGVTTPNADLLAVFLGTASDKTVPVSVDTVIAVTKILGTPVTGDDAVALANDAEEVRQAILAAHG
jgi:hypothetical protein